MAKPTHLSLFAITQNTGAPIARAPFYAEIVVPIEGPEPPVNADGRFDDHILMALRELENACFAQEACRERLWSAVRKAMSRVLTKEARDRLQNQPGASEAAIHEILKRAQAANGERSIAGLSAHELRLILEAAVRAFAESHRLPLAELPPEPELVRTAYPLGVLGTDHVGYLSFDLTRLPAAVYESVAAAIEARRQDINAILTVEIWLYALALDKLRFDALAQGRLAHDAVVVKLEFAPMELPGVSHTVGFLAMQRPSLTDWRLSPASFATNPPALVGQDGCENLLPANTALQEYRFYQVIRLTDANEAVPAALADTVRVGVAHEYRIAWYPLGHSLGQILYSLPLAPGESVNLAVIDWTRRDDAQRKEHTTLDEQIVHNEHRDRIISETVDGALKERQHGSSFMGGIAGSAGASGSYGTFSGTAGMSGAIGGSTSTSDGARNIAAATVQNINDSITQASSAKRELQSTVVVHSNQSEHQAIETRTVVNYNHSHALTILYYEVLRHFRVVTELVNRRPVLLTKVNQLKFDDNQFVLDHRRVLEAALLEPSLRPGFDAIQKYETTKRNYEHAGINLLTPAPAQKPASEGDLLFRTFELGVKTSEGLTDKTDELVMCNLIVRLPDGSVERPLLNTYEKGDLKQNINIGDRLDETAMSWFLALAPRAYAWRDIIGFEFVLHDSDEWRMDRIQINAFPVSGGVIELIPNTDVDYLFPDNGGSNTVTFIRRPGPDVPTPPTPLPLEKVLSADEHHAIKTLKKHLNDAAGHYSRAVAFNEPPHIRETRFDDIAWGGGTSLLDRLENRPLDAIGTWIAFPTADPAVAQAVTATGRREPVQPLDERLITLPTRGVFAEAKLGHCNASEEIDDTRFWDWQQSPIPHMAPDIAPVTPVTPQPQQPNLTPTPFPQSLVNIVNPPAAPDPTGLAAALGVLGTPNIFRDMSGRAEVADLLKRLSDNSVNIAQASNMARQIQSRYGSAYGATAPAGGYYGAGGNYGGGGYYGGGYPPGFARTPSVREQNNQLQQLGKAADSGYITPQRKQQFADEYMQNVVNSTGASGSIPI